MVWTNDGQSQAKKKILDDWPNEYVWKWFTMINDFFVLIVEVLNGKTLFVPLGYEEKSPYEIRKSKCHDLQP